MKSDLFPDQATVLLEKKKKKKLDAKYTKQ